MMGWLIALAVLILLAILPLGASVLYDEDGPRVRIVAGPLKLQVFPLKKKPKKNKPKAEKPKKDKKTKEAAPEGEKPEPFPKPKTGGASAGSPAYIRLVNTAKDLEHLISTSRGRPNKDLAKLADQLRQLMDKWAL